jgi:hypothetical protein
MSRLPAALQPAWPLFKRLHRLLTLVVGLLVRRISPVFGDRGVPRRASLSSPETERGEPEAVRVHPGGAAEQVVRGPAVGDPPHHWVFEQALTGQVPPRYTLEVREGRLVGDHAAVVTPGGVLDYATSPYFGIAGWREHPVFLSARTGPVEPVSGTVLSLATRGATTNYYHFLYDAIGRYAIFEECLPAEAVDAVVVPHRSGYQKQLLAMLGIDVPLIQPRAERVLRVERLLVPSSPNHALDAPPWVVGWLRDRFPPQGSAADLPRRLYLSRGRQPNSRRYVQEPELWPELERRGFTMLDPGSLSVQEQIDVFHAAEVIVAPHGAGLTNITFCRPGAKVLELFAPTYVHLGLWNISQARGDVDHRYLVGTGPLREGKVMAGVLDDVSISPDRVLAAIDELIGE